MQKIIASIILSFCLTTASFAQTETDTLQSRNNIVGIRVGGAMSYVTSYGVKSTAIGGYAVGVVDQLQLVLNVPFYLETGLSIIGKGYQIKGFDDSKTRLHYLHIPIGINYHINVADKFEVIPIVGTYLAIGVAGERKRNGETVSVFGNGGFKRIDFGTQYGLNIARKQFLLGASFNLGMIKIDKEDKVYPDQNNLLGYRDLKNRGLVFSFGYNF